MRRARAVTRKGRVTIPVDGEIRIRRLDSIAATTAGVLRGDEAPQTAERVREMAEEAIAEDVLYRAGTRGMRG